MAELIAAQSDSNKALVAQVKDKAVGLMGLTSEVDTKLLHECFDLDHYDNLLKPEFMDAIRKRREYLIWQEQAEAERKRIAFLKEMKQKTMRCNAIAQRIALQEYLTEQVDEISSRIEKLLTPPKDEKGKELAIELDRNQVEALLDEWLQEYSLVQPDDFFRDQNT